MKIILVRHGQADSSTEDSKRKLTPGGRSDIEKIAKLITGSKWNITNIYSSRLDRAIQTAQIITEEYNKKTGKSLIPEQKTELSPGIPMQNVDKLLAEMNSSDAAVWIFHMPDIASVASYLTGLSDSSFYVTPGTVIALNVPVKTHEKNSMMIFMMQPEQLNDL